MDIRRARLHRRAEPLRGVRGRDRDRFVLDLDPDRGAPQSAARHRYSPGTPRRSLLRETRGALSRYLEITTKFLILFTSKLIILEVVDFVFGDHVELGHFIEVLTLIIAMMAAKAIMAKLYQSLGETAPSEA